MAATFHASGLFRQISSAASFSITCAISAGEGVIVAGSWDQASTTTPTVATTGGTGSDTFTLIYGPFTSGNFKYAAWLLQSAGAGRTGATISWASSSPSFADGFTWSFSGLSSPTLDGSGFNASSSLTAITSVNTATLLSADEFAIGYAADNVSVSNSNAPWTSDGQVPDTGSFGEHQVLTATTPIHSDFTGNQGWITFCLTFRAGAGGAVTIPDAPTRRPHRFIPGRRPWLLNHIPPEDVDIPATPVSGTLATTEYVEEWQYNPSPLGVTSQNFGTPAFIDQVGVAFTTVSSNPLANVRFDLSQVGSMADNLVCKIYATSGGFPTGAALATSLPVIGSTLGSSNSFQDFAFAAPVAVSSGTTYAAILSRTGAADASNFPKIWAVQTPPGTNDLIFFLSSAWNNSGGTAFPTFFVSIPGDTAAFAGSVSAGPSGTLAATEAQDVAALAGFVGVSGALASTDAADVAAFTGSVIVSGVLASTEAADTALFNGFVGVSGTLVATEAADTAAFVGSVIVSGTLVATEAADTAAFTGTVATPAVTGTLVATDAPDVALFNGFVGVSASLNATEATDAAAFSGFVGVSGTIAATEAQDVAAFAGFVGVSGTLNATDTKDTAAFTGFVGVSGTLVSAEAADALAITGFVGVSGALNATDTADTAAITGFVGVSGTLAATDATDTALFNGGPVISMVLGATDPQDTAIFVDVTPGAVTGTLVATEAADVAAFSGFVGVSGTLVSTEAADAAAFTGFVGVSGQLAATEAADAAAVTGFVGVSGTLGSTEAKDAAALTGFVGVSGALVATEATDTAAFAGFVGVSGTLAATETKDTAAFFGFPAIAGTLVATEAPDAAAFSGTVLSVITGTLVATDQKDAAAFTGTVFTVITGTLVATDQRDTAAFAGYPAAVGTLVATDTRDTAAFAVFVGNPITGVLAATDPPDLAKFVVPLTSEPGVLTFGRRAVRPNPW